MTISFPAFPQKVAPQQGQLSNSIPGVRTDSGTQASAFSDLLASLLATREEPDLTPDFLPSRHGELTEEQARRAAALAPSPGAPAEAFSAARLLVEMALNLPGGHSESLTQPSLSSRVETSAIPPGATTARPDNAIAKELPVASIAPDLQGPQTPHYRPEQPALSPQPSDTLTARGLSAANMGRAMPTTGTGTGAAPEPRQSIPLPELPQSRDSQRAAHEPLVAMPSGQTSPFGAQLVRTEGGLQLILRLPKLAENERRALETALTHLLESHGHRSSAIVVHEVVKG